MRPPCSSCWARLPSNTSPSPSLTWPASSTTTRFPLVARTWPRRTPRLAELHPPARAVCDPAGLLGYTPDTLLDEVVDAFAAGDGSAVFGVVDKVIETGQDPRRFTEDLLRRLRDLVIVSAVPDAPATGLIDIAEDAAERLVAQAARFGPADLSRAADLVATGLTEMRGATAPRLLLELICARVLLPGADHSTEGVMARLDRLERRMTITGGDPSTAPTAPTEPASVKPAPHVIEPTVIEPVRPADPEPEPQPEPAAAAPVAEAPEPVPAEPVPAPTTTTKAGSTLTLVDVRRLWPDIVEATKQRRRLTWIYLTQQAQVVAVDDQTLDAGVHQRRGARLVRQRRQRRDRPPGRHRRRRPRLAGRDASSTRARTPRPPHHRRPHPLDGPADRRTPARLATHARARHVPPARPGRHRSRRSTRASVRPRRPARPSPRPGAPGRRTSPPSPPSRPTPTAERVTTTPTPSPPDSTVPSCSQEALGAQVIDEIPHQ